MGLYGKFKILRRIKQMANVPSWFNAAAYFKNKLASMEGYNELTLKTAFEDAGYNVNNSESMYSHFESYGNDEGISPNALFNVDQYLRAKAIDFYGTANVTDNQVKSMWLAMDNAGLSPWQHFLEYGAKEGVNPSAAFDSAKYMEEKLAQMQADPEYGETYTMADLQAAFEAAGLNALTHYLAYGEAEGLKPIAGTDPGKAINLTSGEDSSFGSVGDDYFYAGIGALNTNDYVDGLAGNDTLYAMVDEANVATRPTIQNVETIVLTAQGQVTKDTGENNISYNRGDWAVSLDADRISGMTKLVNEDSRADLAVEDIRIDSNTMTIRFADSDSGDVDFGVFFDNQHLTSEESTTSGTLLVQLIDTVGALPTSAGGHANPLWDNPYTGFNFTLNGKAYTLDFGPYNHETTGTTAPSYAGLIEQIQKAIDADPELSGLGLVVSEGSGFKATVGIGDHRGEQVDGTQIIISTDQGKLVGGNWVAENGLPATNSTSATFTDDVQVDCPLIQTNIELDNVGRVQWDDANPECLPADAIFGSGAGDMVVGAMGTAGGIERFDVTVERGSWLSSLSSTNNTLRMIEAVNDTANPDGQLFIGDSLAAAAATGNLEDWNTNLDPRSPSAPGSWIDMPKLLSTDGLTDVKLFNGSEMTGNINIGAQITEQAYGKYLKDVDGLDTVYDGYAPKGEFKYGLGSGNDTLNMVVNSGIAADRDFELVIDGGAGNDLVNFQFGPMTYNQLRNMVALGRDHAVEIDGGAGNDTIKSWGDGVVDIDGGAGNDVIFAGQLANGAVVGPNPNSTAQNAVFVFNANSNGNLGRAVYIDAVNGAQALDNDILGDGENSYTFVKTNPADAITATVRFLGYEVTVTLVDASTTATSANPVTLTYDELFRAIADAVANDQTMNSLLAVKDGAGNSMIFESLVNGVFTNGGNTSPTITFDNDTTLTNWQGMNAGAATEQASDTVLVQGGDNSQPTVYGIDSPFAAYPNSVYAINIDGTVYYTQGNLPSADVDGLAAALDGARDLNGNFLSDKFTITDNVNVVTITDNNVGATTHDITLYQVGNTTHNGSVDGTQSLNWVDPGVGSITDVNTIVLNVNADAANAQFHDVLDLNGVFGHMDVVHFNGNAGTAPNAVDKISVGDLLNISATAAFNNTLGNANSAVVQTASGATSAGNDYYTVAQFIADGGISGAYNGTTAGEKSVVFYKDNADATKYTVFEVTTDNNSTLNASEVRLLGTIDFDDVATAAGISNGDLMA